MYIHKTENTVCHIWFMCNTFSGCLKLVVSSTLLCWGIAHMRCYWSCLPWIVAWSWWKDNVTSTFLTYCHISHLHWVYRTHPQSQTQTHTGDSSHCPPTFPLISSCRMSAGVTDCLIHPEMVSNPRAFFSIHTSVPLWLNMHTIMYLLLILTFLLLNGLFLVFHSMACAFFLLFLRIWMSMPHWKTTKTKQKKKTQQKTGFQTVEDGGSKEHNINQGCRVRNTAGGSSRHPTSS